MQALSIISIPPGMMPSAMIAATTVAAGLDRREAEQHAARDLRLLEDAHRDLGDDAEQALRAGEDPDEIVERGIEVLAAEPDDLAAHQHDLEPRILLVVRPYLRLCMPPEFSPTLPPIEQAICDDGSGA